MHGKNIKFYKHTHIHPHTHTHIYIYIYIVDQKNAHLLNSTKLFTVSSTYKTASTVAKPWFYEPGCTILLDIQA